MSHTNNVTPLVRVPVLDHQVTDATFEGFHAAPISSDTQPGGLANCPGSFEVLHVTKGDAYNGELDEGWYWWPCFPGCLPDGDPNGPFPTAEGAYLDAIGE